MNIRVCECGDLPHMEYELEGYYHDLFRVKCDCGKTGTVERSEIAAINGWNEIQELEE